MPNLQIEQEKILEAVLFAAGDAVPAALLAEAIGYDIPAVRGLLSHMSERYAGEEAGIQLMEIEDTFQLCTNPKYHNYAKRLLPENPRRNLTQSLLETLSIIAYKQPATKGIIEEIRGVSADHAVNKLMEYGLIEERGRLDAPGKPILFGTSEDFLRYFGLRTVEEFLQQRELNELAIQQELDMLEGLDIQQEKEADPETLKDPQGQKEEKSQEVSEDSQEPKDETTQEFPEEQDKQQIERVDNNNEATI